MRQNFRTTFILPMLVALLSLSASAQTPQRGPSTSTERARAVEVAKALRTDPISPQTLDDRKWLMIWLIEIPDLTVKYCPDFLGDLSQEKKEYSGVLAASLMANEASFMIEHAINEKILLPFILQVLTGLSTATRQSRKKTPLTIWPAWMS